MGESRVFRPHGGRAFNVPGNRLNRNRVPGFRSWATAFSFASVLLFCSPEIARAQVPQVVISSNQILYPSLGGNTHHVAVNSLGDVFYEDDGPSTIFELVPGNPTPIPLVVGLHGGRGVTVDPSNNVWSVNDYDNGNASIIEIPYSGSNGVYPTADISASLSTGNPPVCPTATAPTVVCQIEGQGGGSVTGYFLQATDLGFDAAGNLYVVDNRDNVSGNKYNRILEYPANQLGVQYPNLILIADELPETTTAEMAVDAQGDVYYADGIGNNVYVFPTGSTVAPGSTGPYTTIGTGLKTPGGVGVDAFGNLIITDTGNNRLVEMPYVNGSLQTSQQYLLSYTYSANSVGVDPLGHIYYSGYANSATTIGELSLWNANLGSFAAGTPSGALTVNFAFNAALTPASISIFPATGGPFSVTAGASGPCAAGTPQALDSNCSEQITYIASAAGTQSGAIVLADSSGKAIATGYLYGSGLGSAESVDPGTIAAIGSSWKSPEGIAVDFAHDVYVADSKTSSVFEYSPAGTLLATIGSGLKEPSSVAVDAAGNVFIADSGNGRVVEVPVVNGALSNAGQSVVQTGTSGPTGLSIDAGGNLYIADSGHDKVWRLPNDGGIPNVAFATTVGSSFSAPVAVATDFAGDVFVADQSKAYEVQALTGTQQTIISSLESPGGIALDASGSVYIADTGHQKVIRIPNESGALNPGASISVGAGIANPYAVAIDSSANLYISDAADALVDQVIRSQGTLQFGNVNLNTSSGSETATIGNVGNQTLTFGTPLYSATGDTGSFSISTSSSGDCAAGGTLSPSFDCTLGAVFMPIVVGTNKETLTFSSSAVTPSSLVLIGQAANLAATQLSVAITSPASGKAPFGQPVTASATLTATGGFSTLGPPSGTVTFSVDGQIQGTSPISSEGLASIQLTALSGGTHAVTAQFSGNANYASGSTASPAVVTITQLPTVSTLAINGAATSPLSAAPGSSITLTATVSPALTPGPTGTVTFLSGSTVLGTAPVMATSNQNDPNQVFFTATLTTTTLPTGALDVVASYSGDLNYAASQSASTTLIVSPETITITPSSTSMSLTAGNTGTVTFTVTSLAGFNGLIAASCSGLPANSSCAFTFAPGPEGVNPATPLGNGEDLYSGYPQLVTLQILTGQVPSQPQPPIGELRIPGTHSRVPVSLAFLLLAPLGLIKRKMWKRYHRLILVLLFVAGSLCAMTLSGCENSLAAGTPAGQSTVTLTVDGTNSSTSATVTQAAQIALTVKQ